MPNDDLRIGVVYTGGDPRELQQSFNRANQLVDQFGRTVATVGRDAAADFAASFSAMGRGADAAAASVEGAANRIHRSVERTRIDAAALGREVAASQAAMERAARAATSGTAPGGASLSSLSQVARGTARLRTQAAEAERVSERMAYGATTAVATSFTSPAVLTAIQRLSAYYQQQVERAAYGATTAVAASFASPAQLAAVQRASNLLVGQTSGVVRGGASPAQLVAVGRGTDSLRKLEDEVRRSGERAATGVTTAVAGSFVSPQALAAIQRLSDQYRVTMERGAFGVSTAVGNAFATPASLRRLGNDFQREMENRTREATARVQSILSPASRSFAGPVEGGGFGRGGVGTVTSPAFLSASQIESSARGFDTFVRQQREFGGLLSLNRIGMLELQAAGVNTFQALAAGMDPFHVAMMEGAQVVGAFVQGGLFTMRQAMEALTSPIALVTTGVGLLSTAVAYAAYQNYELEKSFGALNAATVLRGGSGPGLVANTRVLQQVVTRSGELGGRRESLSGAIAIQRIPNASPRTTQALGESFGALARVQFGGDADKAAEAITRTFSSLPQLQEFVNENKLLRGELLEQFEAAVRAKDGYKAMELAANGLRASLEKPIELIRETGKEWTAIAQSMPGGGTLPSFERLLQSRLRETTGNSFVFPSTNPVTDPAAEAATQRSLAIQNQVLAGERQHNALIAERTFAQERLDARAYQGESERLALARTIAELTERINAYTPPDVERQLRLAREGTEVKTESGSQARVDAIEAELAAAKALGAGLNDVEAIQQRLNAAVRDAQQQQARDQERVLEGRVQAERKHLTEVQENLRAEVSARRKSATEAADQYIAELNRTLAAERQSLQEITQIANLRGEAKKAAEERLKTFDADAAAEAARAQRARADAVRQDAGRSLQDVEERIKRLQAESTERLTTGVGAPVGRAAAEGLDAAFSAAIDRVIARARAAGVEISRGSGFRSYEDQVRIHRQHLNSSASPGHSSHESGLAMDLHGAHGALTQAELERIRPFLAEEGLFAPLENWRRTREPWHIEPLGRPGQSRLAGRGGTTARPQLVEAAETERLRIAEREYSAALANTTDVDTRQKLEEMLSQTRQQLAQHTLRLREQESRDTGQARIASARAEVDAAERGTQARIDAERRLAQVTAEVHGPSSAQAIEAQAKVAQAARDAQYATIRDAMTAAEARVQVAQRELSEQREILREMVADRRLTAVQAADAMRTLVDQSNAARLRELNQARGIDGLHLEDQRRLDKQIEEAKAQSNAERARADREYAQTVRAENERLAADFKTAFGGVESSLKTAVGDVLTGSSTAGGALQTVGKGIITSGVDLLGSLGSKALASTMGGAPGEGIGDVLGRKVAGLFGMETPAKDAALTQNTSALQGLTQVLQSKGLGGAVGVKTEGTGAGGTVRVGASAAEGQQEAAGELRDAGLQLSTVTPVLGLAGASLTGAGALLGGPVGQALLIAGTALSAAASAMMLASAIKGIVPFARGGWDVPSYAGGGWSVPGGMAELHPREMVLPSHLADGIRNLVSGGGGSGIIQIAPGGMILDGPSFQRWFLRSGGQDMLLNVGRQAAIDGRLTSRGTRR